MVTPSLFQAYPDIASMAKARTADLEKRIKSTGFFRNKAKSIKGAAITIMEQFNGKVPDNMAELITLPGVARKTANVVLGNAFNQNEGIAVDTHVTRLSMRLGLSEHKDPVKIERDLMTLFDRQYWTDLTHILIDHGRNTCSARKPLCEQCSIKKDCPQIGVMNRTL